MTSQELVQRLEAVVGASFPAAKLDELYRFALGVDVLRVVDEAVSLIRDGDPTRLPRIRAIAEWLVTRSDDRRPVKLGLSLLSLFPDSPLEPLLVLGSHDEFTLYACLAASVRTDGERVVFDIARRVRGWGRIHAVRRLEGTADPVIRDWLLRDGFRNGVMNEYLAYIAATTGGLRDALSAPTIDRELFDSAGELLAALITGGPSRDIGDFGDAREVITDYLRHAEAMPLTLAGFRPLAEVARYLQRDRSLQHRWTEEQRIEPRRRVTALLGNSRWSDLAALGLRSPSRMDFVDAVIVLRHLRQPVLDILLSRLHDEPHDGWMWQTVMGEVTDAELDAVLTTAAQLIRIEDLGTGPTPSSGFGPEFIQDHAMETILWGLLRRFPGRGWDFVRVGLRSPVTRTRNVAVRLLWAWSRDDWPDDAVRALSQAAEQEPNELTRKNMLRVLAGEAPELGPQRRRT